MGGEGARRFVTSGRGCGVRVDPFPLAFPLFLPSAGDGGLLSLRSLLSASASASSSTSLGIETSLWESSATSVATDMSSPSSSSRLRRAGPVLFLGAAMLPGGGGGERAKTAMDGETGEEPDHVWGEDAALAA